MELISNRNLKLSHAKKENWPDKAHIIESADRGRDNEPAMQWN